MKIIKIVTLLLVWAGIPSCKDNKIESGSDVPYKPCPCGETPVAGIKFPKGEAYLFKDSIPEQIGNQINDEIYSAPFPIVCWIVYYSETDDVRISIANLFYPSGGNILSVGPICNFPDFAKEWDIPKNGCKVYLEGQVYEPCNSSGITNVVYIDYVLTKLKRK